MCVGEACSCAGAEADDGGGDEAGAGGAGGYEGGAREITHAQQQQVRYTISLLLVELADVVLS